MNQFTHAHSFGTPGCYISHVVMCQKCSRSGEQSLHINTSCWQEEVCCHYNQNLIINVFNQLKSSRNGRIILHDSVWDETQFAVGMDSLLHVSLAVVFWVQDVLGMTLLRNRILDNEESPIKMTVKMKRHRLIVDWQYDSIQSEPCAPLIHMFTGSGRVLHPQTTLGIPTPSTIQLRVQNSDHFEKMNVVLFVFQTKESGIRFKCPKRNVMLCVDVCFRVFHSKLQFWDHHTGKN